LPNIYAERVVLGFADAEFSERIMHYPCIEMHMSIFSASCHVVSAGQGMRDVVLSVAIHENEAICRWRQAKLRARSLLLQRIEQC
jgi:hypothetical protein